MIEVIPLPYWHQPEPLALHCIDLPHCVILDGDAEAHPNATFSLYSAWPEKHFRLEEQGAVEPSQSRYRLIEDDIRSNTRLTSDIQLSEFRERLNQLNQQYLLSARAYSELTFTGGLLGYLSYDLGEALKGLARNRRTLNTPLAEFGLYGWAIIQDHQAQQGYLIKNPAMLSEEVASKIQTLIASLENSVNNSGSFQLKACFQAQMPKAEYLKAFHKIQRYINAGDCYQTNLTQCFAAPYSGNLSQAYIELRKAARSPFSCFYRGQNTDLLSLSPERFIECNQGNIETKPIKGTIARQSDPKLDELAKHQLKTSIKDRAENLMIVDLLRNDLSMNAKAGTVKVPKLFEVEAFPNVHHLVSTVIAELREDRTPVDLLLDAFPGGSITGAPKKRSMEIIQEIEPLNRSLYCGSFFYLSCNQRMDSNILIRSFIAYKGTVYCWGGGGIVKDSEAESEFEESLAKVEKWMKALDPTRQ